VSYGVALGLFILVLLLCNNNFIGTTYATMGLLLAGVAISGFLNTLVHEFGHIIIGKMNGFSLISFTVWFFNWKKVNKKLKFSFVMMGDEAGYTEMLSTSVDNLSKRFRRLSLGGIFASFIMLIIGVVIVCLISFLPYEVFCIFSTLLPISAYYFLGSLLPSSADGVLNDGGVALGIKKNLPSAQVIVSTLAIQCQLFSGKTPSEIEEKYYFQVPQLPEDDINFIVLLHYRYMYFLDKEDFEKASSINKRISSLMEYIPKSMQHVFKAEELYEACTFNFNEDKADELMYECDKYLNKSNTATNIRIKMAYLKYLLKEEEMLEEFYNKGIREIKKTPIKGYGAFEKKLLDKLINEKSDESQTVNLAENKE
ncbi:MAG: M50 family metallopeptidase, partial [Clostridia bacterium]|nr:M50 family metallopeptidase [Clostridia bacterium]